MKTRYKTTKLIKDILREDFEKYLSLDKADARKLLGSAKLQDKAYELSCLIKVMSELKNFRPNLTFFLSKGTKIVFRGSGGAIQRGVWPFIEIYDDHNIVGELWVDIEFQSLSAVQKGAQLKGQLYGKCHELDVVLVRPDTDSFPQPDEIYIGVEAKHCPYSKKLLKELLGVRREMSFLDSPNAYDTSDWFVWWETSMPASPPSALISFCSSSNIINYSYPADFWGIKMEHHPI